MLVPLLLALAAAPGDSSDVYQGSQGELSVEPPRVESPSVRIDGRLDEPVWERAAALTGFTQYEPVEGAPAAQQTVVRIFYGPDAIYFGIEALDTEPELIRATLVERDRLAFVDDWIRIMLDTFDDSRQAYVFYVNPLGLQQDGLWIEGKEIRRGGPNVPIDFNPDFIWDSEGRVTERGWVAEVRIPYVSLRFRAAESQAWGINVAREVKRSGFKDAWAPLTQDVSSTLAQGGRLVGLRGIEPRRLMEVNPVATGKQTSERNRAGEFVRDDFQPELGVNARFGVTPNLVLDATVNPDFSQLEADEGQIAVNERFALFFPEKRPFFLEGTEVFETPQRLVYTRAIVDPTGGVKLTGKLGSFNAGYLGALDDSPLGVQSGERALFNLVRLRRDVGAGSTIGLLATDRTLTGSGAYNRVAGVDTRLLFGGRYSLTAQLAGSWTHDPTSGTEARLTPASLLSLQLQRSGRDFSWQAQLTDVADDFRARSGFISRTGDAQVFLSGQYSFYGQPGALLERWGPELRVDSYFDHDGLWRGAAPEEAELEAQMNLLFRGKHRLTTLVRYGYFDFQPEDYAGYRLPLPTGGLRPFVTPEALRNMLALAIMPRLQPTAWLGISGRVYFRELPIYLEANRGFEFLVAPSVDAWLTPSLNVDLSHTHSKLWRTRDQSLYSTARITRAKVQYQFTRALSARGVAQYNLQERDALRDPATGQPLWRRDAPDTGLDDGELGLNALLAYEPSPGRVIYLGWAQQMTGANTYRYGALQPQAEGLFIKASYLLRM